MGSVPAASVNPTDCQAFVFTVGTQHHVQRKARAILGSVFTHAMRMGWIQFNPAGSLKLAKRPHKDMVEIFSPADAAEWLRCVAEKAPSCLAGWAIAMFAGLRAAEVQRLDWSEVKMDRGFIEVTAGKSKTRTRRLVEILPNLKAILESRAGQGSVFPHSPKRAMTYAFKEYGKRVPRNGARHSFVSYHLALFGDLSRTEMQAGHDKAVLFQHYRELVTRPEAEAYFAIT